jgi:hypothetical protein
MFFVRSFVEKGKKISTKKMKAKRDRDEPLMTLLVPA